jgi:hypothetical protein
LVVCQNRGAAGIGPPQDRLGQSGKLPRPPGRKEIRMNARSLNATSILVLASLLFWSTNAQAQTAWRTFVSGTGSDANPCTRALPCQTLPAAITQTNTGGEVYVIDALDTPGIFVPVTITKSVSIIGAGARSGISGVVNVAPEAGGQVLLKGLDINLLGSEIEVQASGITLVIDDCTIVNGAYGIAFTPSGTATSNLVVRNSIVSRNNAGGPSSTTAGIFIQPASTAKAVVVIENTNVNNNISGIRAFDNSVVTVRNSVVTQNFWAGIRSEQQASAVGPVTVFVEHTQVSHNGGSGVFAVGPSTGTPAATLRLSDVTATDNTNGIWYVNGGIVYSFGNNSVAGNTATLPPTLIPLT